MKFKQERGDDFGPIFVMIQYAKVKAQGKFPLSVTNTFNVTVLGLNTDLLPMKEFIESFPKDSMITLSGQEGSNSQLSAQNSENQQMTPVQKLLSKAVVMPNGDQGWPGARAQTKMLVASPYGWYYRGCHACSCIARGDRAPFECEAGHFTEAEIFRYKIEIEVTHAGNSCNFLFWDRECELLLGLSASQLRHTMIKAGIHDPLEFPLALDQMLDCKMAFKVKWQPRWKNASVVMLLKNDPFVKELADQFDPDEMKQPAVEAMTTVRSEPNFVFDLYVSSTHSTNPLTPTGKRHFPSASSESTTSDATCNGELSSNKRHMLQKYVADMLRQTKLIIWDEPPMAHKYAIESLDRTLKDVMSANKNSTDVFGGKVVVFGSDFRQILPVVPRGRYCTMCHKCILHMAFS
ncbi:uncharacterized protein LOC131604555 [Vicia villosa]|uniref:uncharacterized protein LOC131604555 n=1 Tax=Vicia villosa TaxID=3911 RepID=UPI00273CA3FF|nr:uncharacterized protein LOC131604555 [Vicia villosa]